MPPIYFYLPPYLWPTDFPTSGDQNWPGFGLGIYAWTLQTYLRLKAIGFPCELTQQIPKAGIVLFHSNAARDAALRPAATRFLICLKAEAPLYPQAQLHVVQNPCEASRFWGCHFMPHWPQPGLLPRDPGRGDRFETVAFLGHQSSLDPVFATPGWQTCLAQMGLQWLPRLNHNPWNDFTSLKNYWHDYRQIDVVVAIRRLRTQRVRYRQKPATKLYNAWIAGIPAVLGRESAYRATGQAGIDYLEANSLEAVLEALGQLKHSPVQRQSMVEAGYRQSKGYQPEAITQRWQNFLQTVAVPAYEQWCAGYAPQRYRQRLQSTVASYCDRTIRRLIHYV